MGLLNGVYLDYMIKKCAYEDIVSKI